MNEKENIFDEQKENPFDLNDNINNNNDDDDNDLIHFTPLTNNQKQILQTPTIENSTTKMSTAKVALHGTESQRWQRYLLYAMQLMATSKQITVKSLKQVNRYII